jgi:hypothetical protein
MQHRIASANRRAPAEQDTSALKVQCREGQKVQVEPRHSARTVRTMQAAAKLCARQGYCGAGALQATHCANASDDATFRHFAHKEDLFSSTLRFRSSEIMPRRDLLDRHTNCHSLEVIYQRDLELLPYTVHNRPGVASAYCSCVQRAELQG